VSFNGISEFGHIASDNSSVYNGVSSVCGRETLGNIELAEPENPIKSYLRQEVPLESYWTLGGADLKFT
jgi:hypothetical protein